MPSLGDNELDIKIKTTSDNRGITETETALASLGEKGKSFVASMGSHLRGFTDGMVDAGKSMQEVGRSVSAISLPIIGIGVAAAKASMDFHSQMELIRTQAGGTQEEVDKMSKSVMELAKSSEFGPTKLAEGLYHLESVGLSGAKAMDALKAASQGAAVGHADLESVTNALAGALKSGIHGTEDMSTTMATLNAIVGAGNMRMNDLASAMGTGVLPAANNFGLSLKDVGAALAELTRTGSGADESATRLRMTFAMMAAPSQKAAGVFAEIGLKQEELATTMRQKGLIPALESLHDHLEKTYGKTEEGKTRIAEALSHAFGGGRSSAAIMTLLQNLDDVKGAYKTVDDGTKNFDASVSARNKDMEHKWKNAWANVQVDLIKIGDDLLPKLSKLLDVASKKLSEFMDWWEKLSPSAKKTIEYIVGAFAIGGPLLIAMGTVITAIGIIGGAFLTMSGIAVTAIGVVSKAAISLFTLISGGTLMGGIAVAGALADIALVAVAIDRVMGAINAMNGAVNAANNLGNGIDIKGMQQQAAALRKSGDTSSAKYKGLINSIASSGGGYSKGGYTGSGADNEVAGIVHKGEYVIPKSQVNQSTGQPKGGSGATIYQTNNIYNQVDMTAANRQLGWRLANA